MQIKPDQLSPKERYKWITSAVIPRPIAFVSSLSPEGHLNLAPFSFFNGVSTSPPILAISLGKRKSGERKDTLRNIEETGEFVVAWWPVLVISEFDIVIIGRVSGVIYLFLRSAAL